MTFDMNFTKMGENIQKKLTMMKELPKFVFQNW